MINCDGSASSSAVIAGLDWLAQNYQLPAVASMSLGSDSPNQALDDAVTAVIALGITAVIAAGNYNQGWHWRTPLLHAILSCIFARLNMSAQGGRQHWYQYVVSHAAANWL